MREYMTPYEAAEIFGVTFRTIYNWVRSGKLRAVKIGKQWRIPKAAVDALLENGDQVTEVGSAGQRVSMRKSTTGGGEQDGI